MVSERLKLIIEAESSLFKVFESTLRQLNPQYDKNELIDSKSQPFRQQMSVQFHRRIKEANLLSTENDETSNLTSECQLAGDAIYNIVRIATVKGHSAEERQAIYEALYERFNIMVKGTDLGIKAELPIQFEVEELVLKESAVKQSVVKPGKSISLGYRKKPTK